MHSGESPNIVMLSEARRNEASHARAGETIRSAMLLSEPALRPILSRCDGIGVEGVT